METRETLRAAKITAQLARLQTTHQATHLPVWFGAYSSAPSAMVQPTKLMKRFSSTEGPKKFGSHGAPGRPRARSTARSTAPERTYSAG